MTTATMERNKQIILPHLYQPRNYQFNLMGFLDAGYKRYAGVWHRRAGKDKSAINLCIKEMAKNVGAYYYFFPTYKQAKKVIWDGIDPRTGIKYLDHFPTELQAKAPNNTEMKITFTNNSLFQLVGTDDFDSIMGTNPRGCVFSEYSLQDPRAWDYIRPILRENGGWAAFIYTFRGKNHGYSLFKMAQREPDWYAELLTVKDTKREDGTPVISEADIDKDRAEGMDEDLVQQEYYCSPEGAIQGAYYAQQLKAARKEGRITRVPYVSGIPVDTWWDLGMDDSTTIWFTQTIRGGEIRIIDYKEDSGEGLAHYAKILREKPYVYGMHSFPHDIEVRELGTGKSRRVVAEGFGIRPLKTVQRPRDMEAVNAGIEAGRNIFSRCWFDEEKCRKGLEALESYHKEYDEENKVFRNRPFHDWSSHAADGWRTFAVGYQEPNVSKPKPKKKPHWLLQ